MLAAAAGWFLWAEHRAHLLGALPYLILLACPLMHVFMHRGHHGHRGAPSGDAGPSPRDRGIVMTHDAPADGLWTLVVLNSAVFLIFAGDGALSSTPGRHNDAYFCLASH